MQSAPQGQPAAQYPANVAASSAANVGDFGTAAPHATPLGFAVSHAGWQRFDKKIALERVDTLLAQALPKALPLAQWQLAVLPQAGGEGQPGHAGAAGAAGAAGYGGAESALSEDSSALPLADASAALSSPATNTHLPTLSALSGADGVRLITVSGSCAPLRLGLALLEGLSAQAETLRAAGARAEVRWTSNGALEILLDHLVYYAVKFPEHLAQLADLAQPLPDAALAIVLDDMGQGPDVADEAAALPFAVTFAIWPRAPHAGEVAAIAAARRLDCLLHQPMEPLPRADHRRPDPGPGALLTSMSAEQLGATLGANLRALPTVIGLNNHMGSAFTGDISLCRTLAGMLVGHGLAVLDSVTRPDPSWRLPPKKRALLALHAMFFWIRAATLRPALWRSTRRQPAPAQRVWPWPLVIPILKPCAPCASGRTGKVRRLCHCGASSGNWPRTMPLMRHALIPSTPTWNRSKHAIHFRHYQA